MSLYTWFDEFYSESAEEASKGSDLHMLDHAKRKFTWALPDNLKKHGLIKFRAEIIDKDLRKDSHTISELLKSGFVFSSSTCALCLVYNPNPAPDTKCLGCPIYKSRDNIRCDRLSDCDRVDGRGFWSPYSAFVNEDDATAMLDCIEKASQFVLEENQGIKKCDIGAIK